MKKRMQCHKTKDTVREKLSSSREVQVPLLRPIPYIFVVTKLRSYNTHFFDTGYIEERLADKLPARGEN